MSLFKPSSWTCEPLTLATLQRGWEALERQRLEREARPPVRVTGPGEVEYEEAMRRERIARERLKAEAYRKAVSRPKAPNLRSTNGRR